MTYAGFVINKWLEGEEQLTVQFVASSWFSYADRLLTEYLSKFIINKKYANI